MDRDLRWKIQTEEKYNTLLAKFKMSREQKINFDLTECAIC